MDTETQKSFAEKYPPGKFVVSGKTKYIHEVKGKPHLAIVSSKNDITADDGARHDVIPEKGRLSNETTCNVFRLLSECGVPTAFKEQISNISFVADSCDMVPVEVVVRREAHGSYLKRNSHLSKGHLFPKLIVEFYLKTSGRRWGKYDLICDDPFMLIADDSEDIQIFDPAKSIHTQNPFLSLPHTEVFGDRVGSFTLSTMKDIAIQTFLVLEKAWQMQGRKLVDFKVEFGRNSKGYIVLADVVDNDSWRVIENDAYIDKQMYRDDGDLNDVARTYERVAELTSRFQLPKQRIIVWRGSEFDDIETVMRMLSVYGMNDVFESVTCSMHKQPHKCIETLNRLIQEVPDSVVIAVIGKSNGAGPTLSALSTVPVITVPIDYKEFPGDVWSSLRTPSEVPVMTVLEQANAVRAVLNIFSANNPKIYAKVRSKVEKRLVNVFSV